MHLVSPLQRLTRLRTQVFMTIPMSVNTNDFRSNRDRLSAHSKWVDRLVGCKDMLFAELRACNDDSVESPDGSNSNVRQTLEQVSAPDL